jgi:hypothetical protein
MSAEAFQVDSTASGSDSPAGGHQKPTWRDADSPAVFDPALSTKGSLTPVRDVMYMRAIGNRLAANAPIKVEISPSEEGRFSVYAPALTLGGVGENLEKAAMDLTTTIESLWDSFANENPDTLTSDALKLSERLRSSFRSLPR